MIVSFSPLDKSVDISRLISPVVLPRMTISTILKVGGLETVVRIVSRVYIIQCKRY
jgi:hypothetical protein